MSDYSSRYVYRPNTRAPPKNTVQNLVFEANHMPNFVTARELLLSQKESLMTLELPSLEYQQLWSQWCNKEKIRYCTKYNTGTDSNRTYGIIFSELLLSHHGKGDSEYKFLKDSTF